MDKKAFKEFCRKEFLKRGFKKVKSTYYLAGKDLLCGIDLQKSNFGNEYYINYFFFLGDYFGSTQYPAYYESDIQGRIVAMSKTMTYQGSHFLTPQIEYEEYTEEELLVYFDNEFETCILPPIYQGKKYILENLRTIYFLTLNQEEVMRKLQA